MRKSFNDYFFDMARLVAERSTCIRAHHGCVLVRDNRVIATGYNGSIPGQEHCEDVGCLMVDNHCKRTIHAEANAIATAARMGHATDGCTAYITGTACGDCRRLLLTAGVKQIKEEKFYDNKGL